MAGLKSEHVKLKGLHFEWLGQSLYFAYVFVKVIPIQQRVHVVTLKIAYLGPNFDQG